MAKMFYTLQESTKCLSRTEEDLKQFAREGRLREFRDGPRLMFKADQVEALAKELQTASENVKQGSFEAETEFKPNDEVLFSTSPENPIILRDSRILSQWEAAVEGRDTDEVKPEKTKSIPIIFMVVMAFIAGAFLGFCLRASL